MTRLLAVLLLPLCGAPALAGDSASAIVWVRTSAEYEASARQAYAAASRALREALRDKYWTAALEQGGNFFDLPPAVILDLDETVLDNSEFQARLARDGKPYSEETWSSWVAEQRARLVPGALDFLTRARASGVALFYVSNRVCNPRNPSDPTAQLLERYGVPLDRGSLMCKDGSGEKGPRRAFIARTHRVLLLIGDDLNDFVSAPDDLASREALSRIYSRFWGERWIILPNPMYGSWERAVPSKADALK